MLSLLLILNQRLKQTLDYKKAGEQLVTHYSDLYLI